MNKIVFLLLLVCVGLSVHSQVPRDVELRIVKAEDARRFEGDIETLLRDPRGPVRVRAALAAGRIGDDRAVERLSAMLPDGPLDARVMAAFALGEIESLKAADAVTQAMRNAAVPDAVRSRLVEAAGKIAAAHAGPANAPAESRNPKVNELGDAILDLLEQEEGRREKQHSETVLLGLTAALRARPEGADTVLALFLTNLDARIRADAANAMARLRAKNANMALRAMLMSDADPIARANAARALGAADDKEAVNPLIEAAVGDEDSRVRVSAIRSLALLRDPFAVEKLLEHGEKLLARFRTANGSNRAPRRPRANPPEKNELLEIAAALGRLVPKTNDARTIRFLTALGEADRYSSPETEIAFARVAPKQFTEYLMAKKPELKNTPEAESAALQGVRELAGLGTTPDEVELKRTATEQLRRGLVQYKAGKRPPGEFSVPDLLRSYAAFKPDGLDDELRTFLTDKSVFIRATAASLLGDRPMNRATFEALKAAFTAALQTDKLENDAQLGLLEAMYKLDRKASVDTLLIALNAPDYLVRRRASEMLSDAGLRGEFPQVNGSLENARRERRNLVLPYSAPLGTRLGQVLNTDADYRRALARRNGTVKAVFTTQKGTFTIDLLPEDAPLTVDNFVKLAKAGFFNGLTVHRVVPNFVVQDGDPLGNGSGGPGWSIRCEVNMIPYGRGAVGMALSGKDTGGSQWFVTHSPQPHLDGGYTVFGRVNEKDMRVVDNIVRGDKIISVRIVEGSSPQRGRR
jgi:cyclophilin family peptidyl-prolyl cis-trans isomerase/HEAT repeat protein